MLCRHPATHMFIFLITLAMIAGAQLMWAQEPGPSIREQLFGADEGVIQIQADDDPDQYRAPDAKMVIRGHVEPSVAEPGTRARAKATSRARAKEVATSRGREARA